MAWENSKDIFWNIDTKFFCNYPQLKPEDLPNQNFPKLEAVLLRPTRDMLEYEEHIVYYPNGDMQVYYTYSVFPNNLVDNIPLFNAYGQKIYNDFIDNYIEETEIKGENSDA